MPCVAKIAERLRNRIWFTRIARIHSEKRILRNEFHSHLLLIVYSIYSIILAIILMKFKIISDDMGAIIGIILSVTLLVLSLYLGNRGFSNRAQRFKEVYTKLHKLLDEIDFVLCKPNTDNQQAMLEEIQANYNLILVNNENHITIDDRYARFLEGSGLTSRKLTCWDWACVYSYLVGRYVILAALYAFPPVILFYVMQ